MGSLPYTLGLGCSLHSSFSIHGLHLLSGLQLGSYPPLSLISSIPLHGGPLVSSSPSQPPGGALVSSQASTVINSAHSGDMSLSISTRPVPARIVSLIRSGRFVEMRDLLGDNATVRSHFEVMHGALGVQLVPVSSRPRVREVPSLPSWVCCFLTFLAVGTSDPVTRDRLSYAILLLREAMRHGGIGWMDYDRLFRQQAAIDPSLSWNMIHPGLQATTILNQRSGAVGSFCNICREPDLRAVGHPRGGSVLHGMRALVSTRGHVHTGMCVVIAFTLHTRPRTVDQLLVVEPLTRPLLVPVNRMYRLKSTVCFSYAVFI